MYLVDSNVFLEVLIEGDRFTEAKEFLNENYKCISTTLVNIMEIFSILTRKYKWKKEEAVKAIEILEKEVKIFVPNEYDFISAYQLQREYLLTTNDAVILSITKKEDAILITYDKELLKYDGIIATIKMCK